MISQAGPFSDPHHELWTLLEGLCEDRLSAEEFGRLEQWVLSDPAARRIYRDYMELHGSLYWDTALAGQRFPAEIPAAPAPALVSNTLSRNRRWISAALVLVVGIAIWFAIPRGDNNNNIADQNDAQQPRNLPQEIGAEPNTEKPSDRANNRSFENLPWPAVAEKPGSAKDLTPPEPSEAVISQSNDARPEEKPQVRSVDEIVAAVNLEIQQGWQDAEVSPSPVARDSEWLRRVYLDLIGQIPPAEAVEQFLSDRRENKRALVVDELLADPAYVRHFATVWTNLLVGRSTERDVDRMALHRFMRESFGRNRPWSEVVADLIAAEGPAEENGASGFLLAHLNNEAVPATAITAKLFLCTQVGCTQCHKHPFNDADQNQFWELNSFFKQTAIQRRRIPGRAGKMRFTEALVSKSEGGPTFYEDLSGVMHRAYPKFAGVEVSPDAHIDRRRELAELMTQGDRPQVARAMVNRTWAHFFGHGFTRPVDDMGPHNPPSHPRLLNLLAEEFVKSGYDVKRLIRWICLSEPYQLSSRFTAHNERDDPAAGEMPLFSRMYVRSMTAEQLYDSLLVASRAHFTAGSSWEDIQKQRQDWLQQFVTAFETEENDEVTEFEGTIPQALLLMNSELVEQAVRPKQGTYFAEVLYSPGSETDKIRKLCLAALSRYPTPQELAAARRLLKTRRAATPDPRATIEALQDIFWAYLNSNEFILVH